MWPLPDCLLYEVLAYLPVPSLSALSQTSHEFHAIYTSDLLTILLLSRDCHLPHLYPRPSGPVPLPTSAQRAILKAGQSGERGVLEYYGFATSGGVDENDPYYWMRKVFCPDNKSYCSRTECTNVNLAGILTMTQGIQPQVELQKQLKARLQLAITNMGEDGYRLKNLVEQTGERFGSLVLYKLTQGSPTNLQEPTETLEEAMHKVATILRGTVSHALDFPSLQRSPDNFTLLEEPIPKPDFPESCCIALLTSLMISRRGGFTCPVETLMVFSSLTYIDVSDPLFDVYNGLTSLSEVVSLPSSPILPATICPSYTYCEFSISQSCSLQPIVWVSFKTEEKRTVDVTVTLVQKFPSLYLYAKLINAEDRRGRRVNEPMNIDVRCIVPIGTLCHLP